MRRARLKSIPREGVTPTASQKSSKTKSLPNMAAGLDYHT